MPTVSFGEGVTPLQGIERRLECTVFILAAHQLMNRVEKIPVVQRTFGKRSQFFLRLAQRKSQLVDAPIVIGILQRTGCILVDTHIIGHITQLVVILMPQASGRGNIGMHILRTALHGFPQCLDVVATQPLQPGIRHHRSGIVPHHATTVSRTGPFGQETALLVSVGQSFLHLGIHGRIHQVEEGEETTESVPETGVGKHIAGQHLTIIGAVVHYLTLRIYLVETAREKHRTVETRVESTQTVEVGILHFNAAQHPVPFVTPGFRHLFKRPATQFLQVQLGLLVTDE